MDRQNNVLEYLDHIVTVYPDKNAYIDEKEAYTFSRVYEEAGRLGTRLLKDGFYKEPIVVFMRKQSCTIAAFFGIVSAGCYYVPLDEELPEYRVELIFQTLNPRAVVCDASAAAVLEKINYQGKIYQYDEAVLTERDPVLLQNIRKKAIDTDAIYIVFTSGSTGIPKGVVACHRSVIDYIETLSDVLMVDENTVFGNQAPLYVDACLKELYPTIKFGATTYLIPKELFMLPLKLVEFLNEKKINTICWVVPALTFISGLGALEKEVPRYLRTVAFGSEVFPAKQFMIWQSKMPETRFINLYGPTEATGMSCFYEIKEEWKPDGVIPIGRPFPNTEIMLLTEDNRLAGDGEQGEICIRGTALTLGYYKAFEKTNEAFVQNPLNPNYPELIYRTGDIGTYNQEGELMFLSRKDYQIKHMGHRIELGEIEMVLNRMPGILQAVSLFDQEKKKIIVFYAGEVSKADAVLYCREKLPRYMVPNRIEQIEQMPLTLNGKIDRLALRELYKNKKGV